MKKTIFLLFLSVTLLSCSDDNNSSSASDDQLSTAPEAKVEYDASNYGVYKGIFVGSSGTVYVNIYNSGSVSAKLIIDGVTYNFTTSEAVSEGTAITGLTFSNGSSSFDFNVQEDGEDPLLNNLNISGHPNTYVQLLKEYSFEHIKCYLGTFNGDDDGVFNLATTSEGYVLGLALPNGENEAIYLDAGIIDTTITGSFVGGTFTGTINDNTMNGIWENEILESGSWTVTRKL